MTDSKKPEFKQYRLESRGDFPSGIVEEIGDELPRPTE